MSHLVREAIRLGARYICPLDGEVMDTRGASDPSRWGHLNRKLNEWHVTPPEGDEDERPIQ